MSDKPIKRNCVYIVSLHIDQYSFELVRSTVLCSPIQIACYGTSQSIAGYRCSGRKKSEKGERERSGWRVRERGEVRERRRG